STRSSPRRRSEPPLRRALAHAGTASLHCNATAADAPRLRARYPQNASPVPKRGGLPDTPGVDLLERQPQLEELAQYLREAGTRAGKIAFVSGEAGAGKSALVEQFTQQAPRGTRILWGHCDALQTSRVLGPVNEVAAALLSATTRREPGDAREQLFLRVLEGLSPPHPVSVVVLEDLHWADEATLDFVGFLGRRIQRTRCLLIVTHRDDELDPSHPLRAVLGELTGQHASRLRVPALSLDAIERLARGTRLDAAHIQRVTAGNAFFVRELLSAAKGTVPETVRDAVLGRGARTGGGRLAGAGTHARLAHAQSARCQRRVCRRSGGAGAAAPPR